MTQSADTNTSTETRRPDVTLDYGHEQPRVQSWWTRARADVQERIDGVIEFLGALAYAVGGWRQVWFGVALSAVLGGLGMCFDPWGYTTGPRWMGVGGFILGLVLPIKKRKD
jgi:hypothetical protein